MSQNHSPVVPAGVYKLFRIDMPLLTRVQIYRQRQTLPSEAAAFRRLITVGLDADGEQPRREMETANT